MDETSLTDFLDESEDGDESEERDETAETSPEGGSGAAIGTYEWTPDGTACERCGTTVNRRWRDDERFVCAECKSW